MKKDVEEKFLTIYLTLQCVYFTKPSSDGRIYNSNNKISNLPLKFTQSQTQYRIKTVSRTNIITYSIIFRIKNLENGLKL